jgi:hypothetical protein
VKSDKNGKTSSTDLLVKVENVIPELDALQIDIIDPSKDPVVVNITAIGAKDRDGVVQ